MGFILKWTGVSGRIMPYIRRTTWRSDRAAGVRIREAAAHPSPRAARSWASEISLVLLIELSAPRIREGLQLIQEGELPASGLRRSAWCSDRAAGVEDPECLQRIQGRRAARSWASEISLVLLIELSAPRIREGLQLIQEGELPAPGLRRFPWCS